MDKYYYLENNIRLGPFTLEELKTKGLKRTSYVWKEGMGAVWGKAEGFSELNDIWSVDINPPPIPLTDPLSSPSIPHSSPPPLPNEYIHTTQPKNKNSISEYQDGEKESLNKPGSKNHKSGILKYIFVLLVVLAAPSLLFNFFDSEIQFGILFFTPLIVWLLILKMFGKPISFTKGTVIFLCGYFVSIIFLLFAYGPGAVWGLPFFTLTLILTFLLAIIVERRRESLTKENSIIGTVRHFTATSESEIRNQKTVSIIVWSFLLERFDENNNLLPPIPIQMRGNKFFGIISEGDKVEVPKNRYEGGTIFPTKVYNHASRSMIESKSSGGCFGVLILIFVSSLTLMYLIFII